ncbi:MAG: methyltransferase [Synergistetes bacterium]|nr:methyltransferase [Synergistota bacterium]MCX8127534.1 methyltransferase [Synergistota bacterium]MDW8191549.1 methyltransferase [Synergistota bacterium]
MSTYTFDSILRGKLKLYQPSEGPRFGIEALLLSDFLTLRPKDKVIELGVGTGIVLLLLALKVPGIRLSGIELQPELVELARKNVEINGFSERIEIIQGDLRKIEEYFPQGAFSVVLGNPPYISLESGRLPSDKMRSIAYTEEGCTLEEFLKASRYLLSTGGRLYLIYRPFRLAELLFHMRRLKIEPKEMRFVHSKINEDAEFILVKGVRDGSPSIKVSCPLILYNEDGSYTEELKKIYMGEI